MTPPNAGNPTYEPVDNRAGFVYRAAMALAFLLLASAGICWVAANWDQASIWTKLLGMQGVLVVLVLLSWLVQVRRHRTPHVRTNHNLDPGGHLLGLAGVGIGALLALIGQIYQTGADAWQLFMVWAFLLIPWLVARHTIFLGLLFALVLNTALGLYLDFGGSGFWADWGSLSGSALLIALFNAVLLGLWEGFIKQFDDPWRIGPRVLAAVVAAWLIVAAFAGLDSGAGPITWSIIGWAALAVMYFVYTRWRPDLVIVSLAALAAFVLLLWPLLYWVGSEVGLLLVAVVLLAAMVFGLRKLRLLSRGREGQGEPWYISGFRLVALGITALVLMAFLVLILDFDVEVLWVFGLALCLAGLVVFRVVSAEVLREMGLTVMTAGLLLAAGSFFVLNEEGAWITVYALLALGVGLYVPAHNAVFRFITAFTVLSLTTFMTRPWGSWGWAGSDVGFWATSLSLYFRMLVFSIAGALVLTWGRSEHAATRWRPLGWALVLLAQIIVWYTPTPALSSVTEVWQLQPLIVLFWLAGAVLPVVALAALLWRRPALPLLLKWGAPLVLAVAAVGWMGALGVSLALLWLIMGHAYRQRSLMVFGVLALLFYLMRFYYQLDTSLLYKSYVLGATGAWLLLAIWVLKSALGGRGASSGGRSTGGAQAADGVDHVQTEGQTAFQAVGSQQGASATVQAVSAFSAWRVPGVLAGLVLVLVVANTGIYQREAILSRGQPVVLELAPVDPRSLIQGDYMSLRFAVAGQVMQMLDRAPTAIHDEIQARRAGLMVLQPDAMGVHRLRTVIPLGAVVSAPGEDVAAGDANVPSGQVLEQDDVVLEFRLRRGQVRVVTDAWFFPEGQAAHFEQARYGQFRVNKQGNGLLVNMLDQQLHPLAQR